MAEGFIEGMGLGGFSVDWLVDKLYFYGSLFLLLLVIGICGAAFIYFRRKEKTSKGKVQLIFWTESASRELEQREHLNCEEIQIPGTRLKLFYSKSKDQWLPRFTREVKKNCFYVLKTPTGNMVNFSMGGLTRDFKDIDKYMDHNDMAWAAENAREFVKRNYKDKSKKWWEAYQGPITTAIYILVMTFSFIIIIYFMRGMVQDLGAVSGQFTEAAKMCQAKATSGLMGAV